MDSLFPKQTNNILPAAPITKPIWPEEMHVTSNEGPVSDFMLGPDSRGRDDEDFAYSDNIVNHVSELVEDAGDGEWEAYAAQIPGLMHSESFDNATLSKNETVNGDGAANAMLNGASLSKLVLSSDVNQGVAKKQFTRTLSNGSGSVSGSNLDFSADIEDIANGSGTASPSSSTSNLTASALPYIPTLALATTVSVRPIGLNSSSGFIFQQPAQPVAGLGSAGTLQIHSATAINGRPPAITSINQSNPSITTVKAGADVSAHGIRPAAVATVRPAGQVQSAAAPVRPMRPPQATQPASTMVSTSNTIPVVAPPAVANAPVLYASSTVSKNSAVVAQPSARPVSARPVLANAASTTTAAPSVSTPAPTASQTPPTESKKLPAAQSNSQPASQSTSQPAAQQSSSTNVSSAPAKAATTNGVSTTTTAATSSTAASLATRPPMTKAMLKMKVNPKTFPTNPDYARFFVIKSFSEDDVHKSIKYSIWASTDSGNHRLDKAYHESASKGPIYLFFSVNASGHFQGMAQMVSPVDYHTSSTVWAQDKWKGIFEVKWAFIKDIPNHALRNIKLSNNENKPVTNSRDTQEILLDPGREILQIFHQYSTKTSILDDFDEYDKRHPVPEAAPVVVPTPPRASSRDSSATSSNHNTLTKTNSKAGSNSATRNGTEVATQN